MELPETLGRAIKETSIFAGRVAGGFFKGLGLPLLALAGVVGGLLLLRRQPNAPVGFLGEGVFFVEVHGPRGQREHFGPFATAEFAGREARKLRRQYPPSFRFFVTTG